MKNAKRLVIMNNKGGVGKTTLTFHLAHIWAELGKSVLVADLDPQSNLTAMFLGESQLEAIWPDEGLRNTVAGALRPLKEGTGMEQPVELQRVNNNLWLLAGDLELSAFEDELAEAWSKVLDDKPAEWRKLTAIQRLINRYATECKADIVLFDIGPNLGALNRASLISTDFLVVPLATDLFSRQGLKNLGSILTKWRKEWNRRLEHRPQDIEMYPGQVQPIGYVMQQHTVRKNRPVKAYQKWAERLPVAFHRYLLNIEQPGEIDYQTDPYCLGLVKNYMSLLPMAMEVNKPVFKLKAADGAIGNHQLNVKSSFQAFRELALSIESAIDQNSPMA